MRVYAEVAKHKRGLGEWFQGKGQALHATYAERTTELKSCEDDLSKLRKELDDHRARHARRDQSRAPQIKISDHSENSTLTPSTQRKRQPVHAIFVDLLVFSAALIADPLLTPVMATKGADS